MTRDGFNRQVSDVAGVTQKTAGLLLDFLRASTEQASKDRLSLLLDALATPSGRKTQNPEHGRVAISILAAITQAFRFGSIQQVAPGTLQALASHMKPEALASILSNIAAIVQRDSELSRRLHLSFPLRCLGYASPGVDIRQTLETAFGKEGEDWTSTDQLGQTTLLDGYADAKRAVQEHLAWRVPGADYLVVDYVWLPELIASGNIEPIDRAQRAIAQEIARWEERLRNTLQGVPQKLLQGLLDHLCWSNCDSIYCLPLTLNWHGYCPPTNVSDLTVPPTFEEQLAKEDAIWDTQHTMVQNRPSACLAYELCAHCAYSGITLLDANPDKRVLTLGLRTNDNDSSVNAVASLLFRIRKGLTNTTKSHLNNDQVEQKQHLVNSTKSWYPTITHEVCRLADTSSRLNVPLCRASSSDYLTCFGGFGLAISRNTRDRYLASEQLLKLAQGLPILPDALYDFIRDAGSKIAESENGDVQRWIARHTRPRVAFWTRVEEVLSAWVEDVLRNQEIAGQAGADYSSLVSAINDQWKQYHETLLSRLRVTANNAGWRASVAS